MADAPKLTLPPKDMILKDMEHLIHQFILITKGPSVAEGEVYMCDRGAQGRTRLLFCERRNGEALQDEGEGAFIRPCFGASEVVREG